MTKRSLKYLMAFSLIFLNACTGPAEDPDSEAVDELSSDSGADSESASAEEDFDEGESSTATNEDQTEAELEEFGDEEVADAPAAEETPAPEDEVAFDENDESDLTEEPAPETAAIAAPVEAAPAVINNRVTAINYLASANGGSIEIKTSAPASYSVRPNPNTNQYVIEIQNAALAESLKRPFIMKDFEGSFGAINAYQNPNSTTARIVVQLKGGGEPVVSQEGNSLLVVPGDAVGGPTNTMAVNAAPKAETEDTDASSYDVKSAEQNEKILSAQTLDEFLMGSGKFFGRPISIQTNAADVRDVISFIAEESGVNLVISDDVEGKVSVKLRQVPWDQALVIVMRARGLGYVRQGNVLRITKLSTLQAEANSAKDIVESQKRLTPLKVKVYPVSYASVTDLAAQLKPFLSEQRGQVVSDTRTSTIIITDTADVLMRIERLVRELDIPPAQVMIEGKIVEASESFNRRIGVNWSLSGSSVDIANKGGVNGTALSLKPGFGVASLAENQLQAQNGFFSLHAGTLDFLGSLDATLSLAQADSLVRIISSPRIVTMNKEKSHISQKGEVITIQSTVDQNNNKISTAVRAPVELKLEVTPQITNEGSVVLEVNVLRQFVGAIVDPVTQARPINSREAKTKVLVPNGQTAVIGGIYQSDETEGETGVPVLKDIPVLGWLFKQKSQDRQKNELLLFLTPRILNAKDQTVTN